MALVAVGDNVTDCYVDLGQMFPGGNCVNVAVHAARAGSRTAYVGRVGEDARGELLRRSLASEGVAIERLVTAPGVTGFAEVRHVDGDRVFGAHAKGASIFTPDAADLAYISRFRLAHVSYCSRLESTIAQLATITRVSFDFDKHADDDYTAELLPHVWAAHFSGAHLDESESAELMRWAHSRGPEVVVVTQGERGGAFFDGTTITRVPAAPTQLVDTLGAGDAFIGGVLHGLLAGAHPHVFLARAAALAARVCQSWGGFGHGVPLALQSESAASPAGVPCTSQLA